MSSGNSVCTCRAWSEVPESVDSESTASKCKGVRLDIEFKPALGTVNHRLESRLSRHRTLSEMEFWMAMRLRTSIVLHDIAIYQRRESAKRELLRVAQARYKRRWITDHEPMEQDTIRNAEKILTPAASLSTELIWEHDTRPMHFKPDETEEDEPPATGNKGQILDNKEEQGGLGSLVD